jgi:hypothetical protein
MAIAEHPAVAPDVTADPLALRALERAEALLGEVEAIMVRLPFEFRMDLHYEMDRLQEVGKAADPAEAAREHERQTGTNRWSAVYDRGTELAQTEVLPTYRRIIPAGSPAWQFWKDNRVAWGIRSPEAHRAVFDRLAAYQHEVEARHGQEGSVALDVANDEHRFRSGAEASRSAAIPDIVA